MAPKNGNTCMFQHTAAACILCFSELIESGSQVNWCMIKNNMGNGALSDSIEPMTLRVLKLAAKKVSYVSLHIHLKRIALNFMGQ